MTVSITEDAFVVAPGQTVNLGTAIQVTQTGSNPAYLVLNGLDRNEYTASSTGATGSLNGNGASDGFTKESGDQRQVGIVFAYQASTGRYYNATYGYLDQITYRASTNVGDVTNLSLFGTNITNEHYYSFYAGLGGAGPGGVPQVGFETGELGTPRTYGLRLRYRFGDGK